jgi:hypothetical protein
MSEFKKEENKTMDVRQTAQAFFAKVQSGDTTKTEKESDEPTLKLAKSGDGTDTFSKGSRGAPADGAPADSVGNRALIPVYSYDENGEVFIEEYLNPEQENFEEKVDDDDLVAIRDGDGNIVGYASEEEVDQIQIDFDETHNPDAALPPPEDDATAGGNDSIGDDDTEDKN